MPFVGSDQVIEDAIRDGELNGGTDRWKQVSAGAKHFMLSLLEMDPEQRLTAEAALKHPWLKRHVEAAGSGPTGQIDPGVKQALCSFSQASKFRRCCSNMLAWSLSNDERAKVREHFLRMDKNMQGTITLGELREAITETLQGSDEEVRHVFEALDFNHTDQVNFSEFLAAMVSTQIDLHDDLMNSAFQKFDTDGSGFITAENLREVLGDRFEGNSVAELIREADILKDDRISYPEFVAFLRGVPLRECRGMTVRSPSGGSSTGLRSPSKAEVCSWDGLRRLAICA